MQKQALSSRHRDKAKPVPCPVAGAAAETVIDSPNTAAEMATRTKLNAQLVEAEAGHAAGAAAVKEAGVVDLPGIGTRETGLAVESVVIGGTGIPGVQADRVRAVGTGTGCTVSMTEMAKAVTEIAGITAADTVTDLVRVVQLDDSQTDGVGGATQGPDPEVSAEDATVGAMTL